MKKISLIICTIVMCFAASSAYAIDWSTLTNLLVNPGAETGDLTGWDVTGPWYATTSQVQTTGTVTPYAGDYFFSSAQSPASLTFLDQTVDVSGYSAMIDAGLALFNVGFYYQTEYDDAITGAIVFLNAAQNEIDSDGSGEESSSAWTFMGEIGIVPFGTRYIAVEIDGILHSGSYVNAFIDEAHLKIGQDCVIPEPASMFLLGSGILGLFGFRRKSRA
jgi:PEP-CTERM motif